MEQSLHIQSKSRVRYGKGKIEEEETLSITKAAYIGAYQILVSFSNGRQRIINFEPILKKHLKGEFKKYLTPSNFKKFFVENGNIYWGKNEDVIFPVTYLYNSRNGITQSEEVLYLI